MDKDFERIIIGIDPGTRVMGYGILGINGKEPKMVAMGVIKLDKFETHYLRLKHIYDRVLGLVEEYLPDEMAIEAPFYGKDVQAMLKLGRAQGVAMAAALSRQVPIHEYEPRLIKKIITGNGAAAKEQVKEMLKYQLKVPIETLDESLDATDALAVAFCHFHETAKSDIMKDVAIPVKKSKRGGRRSPQTWGDFVANNPDRVKK